MNAMTATAIARFDLELDDYEDEDDPEEGVIPLTLRTTAMQLVWVCGDCGAHHPRHGAHCPDLCSGCGAPREHLYSPIED